MQLRRLDVVGDVGKLHDFFAEIGPTDGSKVVAVSLFEQVVARVGKVPVILGPRQLSAASIQQTDLIAIINTHIPEHVRVAIARNGQSLHKFDEVLLHARAQRTLHGIHCIRRARALIVEDAMQMKNR